jgi:universal stress protein E
MRYFTKLLVCVAEPGGDLALRYAARLAAATRALLTLADVVEDVPAFVRRLLPRSWNVPELVRAQKQADLQRSAARARRLGMHPEIVLLRGAPVKALVGEVRRGKHDLLVVGAVSAESIQSIRTTAVRLVRECPCPVLLVHPSRGRRRPRVLAAVDVGPWRRKRPDALDARLLEAARWFAESEGGDLHVLHVWDAYGERLIRGGGLTDADVQRFVAAMREDARRDLERTLAPFWEHIAPAHVHLEKGDPREVIPAFAADHHIDLLVIGTVARSGLAARITGNTAEAVLARLPCSMLIVPPERAPARTRRASSRAPGRSRKRSRRRAAGP